MDLNKEIDRFIERNMLKKHIPGLALAVVKEDQIVHEKCYGLANLETGTPVHGDTLFEIASITKGFTALAILMLRTGGHLSLDDPLGRFRPGLRPDWDVLTLRHLLTHTSGVHPWGSFWAKEDLTAEEICDFVFDRPLRFSPGDQWEYIDTNYNILGMVIHRITGAPYDAFLQERIFKPLGMSRTRHNDWRSIIPDRASGYDRVEDRLVNSDRVHWNQLNLGDTVPANGANGSLLSTLADLLKWDAALSSASLLPRQVLDEVWTPVVLSNGKAAPYGLGCGIEDFHGGRFIEYGGGTFGFTTCVGRFNDRRLTVIILTNQDSKPWDMCKEIALMIDPVSSSHLIQSYEEINERTK